MPRKLLPHCERNFYFFLNSQFHKKIVLHHDEMALRVTEMANELTNELDSVGAEGIVRLLRQVSVA